MKTRFPIEMGRVRTSRTNTSQSVVALEAILFISTLVILLIPTGSALGQSAEDAYRFAERFPATGSKQLGMAGVSRAGMADWTTVATNPAGLGWMKRGQVLGSLNTWSTSDDGLYQLGSFSSALSTQSDYTHLGNAGYVYKAPVARGSMAFGIGYNQMNSFRRNLFFDGMNNANSITDFFMPLPGEFELVYDDGPDGQPNTNDDFITPKFFRPLSDLAYQTYGIDLIPDMIGSSDVPFLPAVVRGTVSQSGEVFEEGGTEEFTLGGAVEAAQNVMVGAGINFAHGNYQFNRHFDEFDVNNANDGSGITTDFESLSLDESIHSNMWGVNLRAGVSAEAMPGLLLGATVETPTQYSVSEDYSMLLDTYFDNGDAYSDRINAVNDYNVLTPWRFGGGAQYEISMVRLSADAEYVNWSQLELKPKQNGDFSFEDVNREIRQNYNGVVNAYFGAEAALTRMITVRGGYGLQPDPRKTAELDRSKQFFSAGLGLRFQRTFEIDLGWTNEQFDDRYQPYFEVDNAPIVAETVKRNRVALGFRFYL